MAASVIRVNGVNRATTFVSGLTLTASIPASDVSGVGTLGITVFNPAPGGGVSGSTNLTVASAIPAAPTGLSASAQGSTSVSLTWNASTGATGYKVYSVGANGSLLLATVSGGGTTSYTDNAAQASSQNCYKVSATNSAGESAQSSQACATTP